MLTELNIRNYALIDSLKIEFAEGMNVLTGETGAGKSIIIDAIGLLLGAKGNSSFLRNGTSKCEISGIFNITKNRPIRQFLKSVSLLNEEDSDSLFLRREIDSQGKSRAFVNDKPVTIAMLSEVGDYLVDIHGQHEHQLLLKTSEQRDLLDRYAKNEKLREDISRFYAQWKNLVSEKESSQLSEQERNQRIDLYRFQKNEIDSAKLVPGEEEEIERILPQLKNSEKLRIHAEELFQNLYEAEGSILERLSKCQKTMESIQNFGVDLKESPQFVNDSLIQLREVSDFIESFRSNLISDPKKLDELLGRLDLIARLKKKYGSIIPEILAYKEKIQEALQRLENHSESIAELGKKIEKSYGQLIQQCEKLTAARKKYAEKLSSLLEKEFKDLGFAKGRFSVSFDEEKNSDGNACPTSAGLEKVEFLFSANLGQSPESLKEVASGGELSRIMLALKKIMAESDLVSTLIFDEIDSGVGGSMGHVIGEKLKALSHTHQILLITHLPQIAAFAEKQIAVRKNIADRDTHVTVQKVEKNERICEIARMLGGSAVYGEEPTKISLKHASELLENAKTSK